MKTPHALPSVFRRPGHLARLAAVALLSACGGGGGGLGDLVPLPGGSSTASSQYAQQCSASNPFVGDAEAATRAGSLTIEKQWVRAYIDEAYLWYSKVPSVNASLSAYSVDTPDGVYGSIDAYFSALTVDGLTEDRFSFTYPTKQWKDLSESGISLGYGIELSVTSSAPPRDYRVAFVEPASPAQAAGVRRGDRIVSIDGVGIDDVTTQGIATLNAGLFPSAVGTHTFVFSRGGVNQPAAVLTAAEITRNPVPLTQTFDTGGAKVGYILFNDHVLTAEARLADAITSLRTQGITDLVLDLRYNGGGYLFIASELAYMVAGEARTSGKTFERLQYNDKRAADTQNSNTPFFNVLCLPDLSTGNCSSVGTALPTLTLARMWVLAGPDTCSASEAVVNGLRGVDVQVNIIGGRTCGKPYGFTAKDNCGISYFPIEFKGVNAKGFGDYSDGFAPTCAVNDDFSRELGDPTEGVLAAALAHRATGTCPTAGVAKAGEASLGRLLKGPERSNRLALPKR